MAYTQLAPRLLDVGGRDSLAVLRWLCRGPEWLNTGRNIDSPKVIRLAWLPSRELSGDAHWQKRSVPSRIEWLPSFSARGDRLAQAPGTECRPGLGRRPK